MNVSASTSSTSPDARGSSRARRDELVDVEISDIAQGGRGLARREGYVIFVSGALPGDRVRAQITKSKRNFAEANAVEMLQPSPDRIPDRCTHEGEPCPGAPWQGFPYERQLAHKQAQVTDALRRIGGFDGFETDPIEPAGEQWRYRNKLEYTFGSTKSDASADGSNREDLLSLGFHARGRWDRVIGVEDCHLASERGNEARNRIRDWARSQEIPAYDRRDEDGVLRNLIVREGRRSGDLQTRLVTSPAKFERPPVDLHTVIEGASGSTDGPTGALGSETITETLRGLDFEVSHRAFFQTNTEMAERLYAAVAEMAALSGSERVFDLYCGIGTIGLTLAAKAGEVWGLELVSHAVRDAERNAERNSIGNATFVAGSARTGVRPLIERAGRPDVVVIDPPRAGLSQKIVRRLIECDAKRIVYVSCNPTTLAPNAAQLGEAGYRLSRVRPVDMFPQTPHIECVALLEKDPAG